MFGKFLYWLSFSLWVSLKDHPQRFKKQWNSITIPNIDLASNEYSYTGWPTKMSLFFFGNNFSKNKETFKIFSPQTLEVYRILLMETSLESIMFCYTFSIINTMFVPCTVLLYDNTAATRTLKLSTTLLSISCGTRLISFLMMSSLSVDCFHKLCLSVTPIRKYSGGLRSWE